MYGLLDKDIDYIVNAFNKFSQIEKVIIFGSRAMGNYKKGSRYWFGGSWKRDNQ